MVAVAGGVGVGCGAALGTAVRVGGTRVGGICVSVGGGASVGTSVSVGTGVSVGGGIGVSDGLGVKVGRKDARVIRSRVGVGADASDAMRSVVRHASRSAPAPTMTSAIKKVCRDMIQ
jgi:hypothetical protein